MSNRVIVVGGGIIGAACAHYLVDAGWQVQLIERGRFGGGCSHGNCGYICPSHMLPLSEPGAVGRGIKAMLLPNSPFSIRPRFDVRLWGWLCQFARRCNERDMLESAHACFQLLQSSALLYRELMSSGRLSAEWHERGLLFVYRSARAFEDYARTDELLSREFDLPAERIESDELPQLEPALRKGLAGAWYYRDDAHVRPDRLLAGWRDSLAARGVTVVENCELREIEGTGGAANTISTSQGPLAADALVIATGAWTPWLADALRVRIPIQPGKGYSITMPSPQTTLVRPALFPEHKVGVTPFERGYRLGSTMEFAGYDTRLNRKRLKLLTDGAAHYLQESFTQPVEEEWYGFRPMTYDGKPVIGRCPQWRNVVIAAGHNMLGMSMAPATGKLVAEILSDKTPHIDPAPYAAERFR